MSAGQDLAYASIASVAELVRRKEISPVELTERTLARIEAIDPKINSFYTVFREEAVAAARNAEAEIRQGQYRGPLHGIPIGIKDIYQCGPTTCGSKTLKDYVAPADCTAVAKLKARGRRGPGQKCDLRVRLRLSDSQILLQARAQSLEPGVRSRRLQ